MGAVLEGLDWEVELQDPRHWDCDLLNFYPRKASSMRCLSCWSSDRVYSQKRPEEQDIHPDARMVSMGFDSWAKDIILEIKVRCFRIHCTGSQGFQTNKSMQAVRTDFFWVRHQLSQVWTTKFGRGAANDAAKKNYDDDCEGIPEWKRVLSQAWET